MTLYDILEVNVNELPLDIRFRFVRDFSLPFPVLENPYFAYYIATLLPNNELNIEQKLKWLNNDLSSNEINFDYGKYLREYHKAKDSILEYLQNHQDYQNFSNNFDMSKYDVPTLKTSKNGNVYNEEYVNQKFISIDLTEANFQVLSMISKDMVFEDNKTKVSFAEFVSHFTDLDTVKYSKQIRQQLLGKLNAKRLIKLEKYAIYQIYEYLVNELNVDADKLLVSNKDELVFSANDNKVLLDLTETLDQIILDKLGYKIHTEVYTLKKIANKKMYMKLYEDGTYGLKNVPTTYYMQVLAYLNSRKITEMELAFTYENNIAYLKDSIFKCD